MTISGSSRKTQIQHPHERAIKRENHEREPHATATAALLAALVREEALLLEKSELLRRQDALAQEFEHRLLNSLQLVSSMLTLQCRNAKTPEAAAQLNIAARRVGAVGRVHCRLHLLDHQEKVEFKQYLQGLCDDLAGLLFSDPASRAIVVQSAGFEIPTALGIPLGFIVNELITNATKYTKGDITVRIETTTPGNHSLSVLDEGPGLPAGFDPTTGKGLGMKIILLLAKQIGGAFHSGPGDNGCGARFTITFCSTKLGTGETHSSERK
jgi:two-component system, sensor histidine kinase PdtaS